MYVIQTAKNEQFPINYGQQQHLKIIQEVNVMYIISFLNFYFTQNGNNNNSTRSFTSTLFLMGSFASRKKMLLASPSGQKVEGKNMYFTQYYFTTTTTTSSYHFSLSLAFLKLRRVLIVKKGKIGRR